MNNVLEITKSDIAQEKLRRQKEKSDNLQAKFSPHAEDGFWEFCKYMHPDFYSDDKPPLKKLCSIFHGVAIGKYKKVLISVFRRFGKSRTTNLFIAWMIAYDINSTFMRNCYSAPLAIDLSRKTLSILTSENFIKAFPDIKLDPKMNSKIEWKINNADNTTYFGTGIEGSIIGRGCKTAAILDDPIKNAEEALNDGYIESLELFIETVHNTCIDPSSDCAQIIISTRWSANDPIGQRIDDPSWTTFTFPALDENDKSICEAIVSTEKLIEMRNSWINKGFEWMWESMYQCKPITNLISKFSVDELKRFRKQDLPKSNPTEIVAFLDYANKGSDFLSMPIAYCWGQDRYIVDVVFSDEDSKKLRPIVIKKILAHKPEQVVCETNHGGEEFVERIEEEAGTMFYQLGIELIPQYTNSNKEIRILVRTGEIIETCRFLIDSEQDEQYKKFFNQLTSYGKYKRGHDDAPDSMAGLLGILSNSGEVNVEYFGKEKKYLDNNFNIVKDENENENTDCEIIYF